MLELVIHYGLHFLAPGLIAWFLWPKDWLRAWYVMLLTMLVDLDHLFSVPIFDENRCSIGFHPFHSVYAIVFYLLLAIWPRSRVVAVGLLLHMFADSLDCVFM